MSVARTRLDVPFARRVAFSREKVLPNYRTLRAELLEERMLLSATANVRQLLAQSQSAAMVTAHFDHLFIDPTTHDPTTVAPAGLPTPQETQVNGQPPYTGRLKI